MSACISGQGEYSDHVPDETGYICERCRFEDIGAVLAELKSARARIDAARHSYARVQSRFIAVAHLLDAPFTNRTDVSPWSLIKGDMANLKKALSDDSY